MRFVTVLREIFRMFEYRVLRRISVRKRQEAAKGWRN
jgi:hypothetical protein